jgi:CO/xanthine dehydrogenase Mo-binding subunit
VKRRDFLKGTACFSVAVVLGPSCATRRGALLADGSAELSAWIRIYADDRVVYVFDRAEMGQGVMTSHTMMVAEELGIPPSSVELETAPVDKRYNNPAGSGQNTSASNSTRGAFEPLRKAASGARQALLLAAAEKLNAKPDALGQKGRAFFLKGDPDTQVRFGELVERAPRHMPKEGKPKAPSEWQWVGKDHPRLDAAAKVFGKAQYGSDHHVPGLQYATLWRELSPTQRKTVKKKLAENLSSDLRVVEVPSGIAVVGPNTWGPLNAIRQAMASDWGQAVLRSGSLNTEAIRRELSRALTRKDAAEARDDGNFEKDDGKSILKWHFSFPFLPHQTMEPMNCTARVDFQGEKPTSAELWVSTQGLDTTAKVAARILGIDASRVKANQTLVGGGFGRRGDYEFVEEAVEIAFAIKAPVRVTWSREQDILFDRMRPATEQLVEAKVKDGRFSGYYHRVAGPSLLGEAIPRLLQPGSPKTAGLAKMVTGVLFNNEWAAGPIAVECLTDLPYAIPNLRVEHAQVEAAYPITFWRANGAGFNAFVFEHVMDEVARHLKKDPVSFRLEMLEKSPRHAAVLKAAAEASGWGKRELAAGRALGAAVVMSYETYVAQVAEVSVEEERIRVHKVWVAVDCGTAIHPDGVRQQMESGVIYGLSAALHQKLDFQGGRPAQSNFHDVPILRMNEAPEVETVIVNSGEKPTGIGEPGVPPIAPAVANALRALGHGPFRALPLRLDG